MVDLLQRQELTNPVTRKLWQSNHIIVRIIRKLLRMAGIGQFNVPVYERRESSKREIAYYKQQIASVKKLGAEYIVACLHIGGQYNDLPTEYTKEICQLSLELGVNAVIANHEHVIHGIDMRHLSKQTFCIYSLGNFLSASGVVSEPFDKMAEYSVAVNLYLTKAEGKKILAEYSFEIFCNVLNMDNKVISVSLFDYINSGLKEDVKKKLLVENNVLVNRILNTVGVEYPLLREYRVPV